MSRQLLGPMIRNREQNQGPQSHLYKVCDRGGKSWSSSLLLVRESVRLLQPSMYLPQIKISEYCCFINTCQIKDFMIQACELCSTSKSRLICPCGQNSVPSKYSYFLMYGLLKSRMGFPLCVFPCLYISYIQGVTGGTDQTSGECSLGQTIPI